MKRNARGIGGCIDVSGGSSRADDRRSIKSHGQTEASRLFCRARSLNCSSFCLFRVTNPSNLVTDLLNSANLKRSKAGTENAAAGPKTKSLNAIAGALSSKTGQNPA